MPDNLYMPDLSVIIVSYKGYDRLKRCLESLSYFSGKSLNTEVIVVDNQSGDETIKRFEEQFSEFRFIYNDVNGGFANGCNKGAINASGEFLLFLNPDTVVTEGAVEKLVRTAKNNPDFFITSCRQVNNKGKESIAFGPFPGFRNLTGIMRALFRTGSESQIKLKEGYPGEIIFPDWISGSVVLISRENYRRLKGFDEDYWMYFEDVDLCRRARNTGGEIAFCRNVTIEHNHGGSSRTNIQTTSITKTEVFVSKHIYINKHKRGFEKYLIQSFLVINNLISFGLMALAGLLFFFIPKLFCRTLIYLRLIKYYTCSLLRCRWESHRSVNYRKTPSDRI